ncbi:MAG: Unknown protein [uncultured Thiotrichaceae bacterium]|uniref:HTH lysR-type domain-containing protein n=1 Tax=uncultured Thiotrichaceae bacterium TaxID=298394 RepID=A0A6S6SEQ8_9GAMM|nr:MAG: Unknown protein [uncultured Thiotrichaceae bacterium]
MKHYLPQLDSLKVFEAAARHLSFSLAADELCMTKSAISYQIRKLEEQIQCRLFNRSVRQVYLTEAGQQLFKTTQQLFKKLDSTLLRLQDNNQQAAISIAASTYVAARWLSPRIARFSEQYPDIAIHLRHSVNSANFKLKDVDLAISWCRCNNRKDPNRLREIPMPLFPVGSPALLKRMGISTDAPDTGLMLPTQLNQLPLLTENRTQDLWQEWFSCAALHLGNPQRLISDANVRVQAAIDGQGLILADTLMQAELDGRLLIPPFPQQLNGYGYALMQAPGRIINQNTQALTEWLVNCDNEIE